VCCIGCKWCKRGRAATQSGGDLAVAAIGGSGGALARAMHRKLLWPLMTAEVEPAHWP